MRSMRALTRYVLLLVLVGAAPCWAQVGMSMVHVGDTNNPPDMRYAPGGRGSVSYEYWIGKYEVTAGQYCDFLNAVAGAEDPHYLYHWRMPSIGDDGCMIERTGTAGDYSYAIAADWADRPVNYVNCFDALRYCNWLTNGAAPGADTETGSYDLTSGDTIDVTRSQGARYVLPNENEWYKAAYYDPGRRIYYDYPTGSSQAPAAVRPENDTGNSANYYTIGPVLGEPYQRHEAGAYRLTKSPYGVHDLAGNVTEWSEMLGSVEGGSYGHSGDAMMRPWPQWWASSVRHEGASFGFRVALVPEPVTFALLGAGWPVLIWRRRRRSRPNGRLLGGRGRLASGLR